MYTSRLLPLVFLQELKRAEAGHFEKEAEAVAETMVSDAVKAFASGKEVAPAKEKPQVSNEEVDDAPDKYTLAPDGATKASIREGDLWVSVENNPAATASTRR